MAVRQGLLPDRYTGPQPVGRGGMGEIYRATDSVLGRAVAIKLLDERFARDGNVRARFTREALAAARLSGSPSIVTIYDVGEWNGHPFIVMEYLGGGSLEQRLREGAVPTAQALEWLDQAAHALDAAHREGVVHRDVKPGNLLLDRHGRVHVADFGIASAAGLASLTQTGTVLGTAGYLSPEQARGERATPASDLYALAIVAFELLTGRRPFDGESMAAEAAAHVAHAVPSVWEVDPHAPDELDPVFARALAKDPAGRYPTATDLVAALRGALSGAATPTRIVYGSRRRRRLLPFFLAASLAVIGVGVAYAITHGGSGAGNPPARQAVRSTAAKPTTAAVVAKASDPHVLNERGYGLMQQRQWAQALPLLERAVRELQGHTSDVVDGWANYNLGVTLLALGRCADAVGPLQAAQQLEPDRHEVDVALRFAERCSGGDDGGDG